MRILIALTIFCLLAKPAFPVIEYVVQYEYISKVLCENKARPELHCNGKCHLMKELAKASEAEKNDTNKPGEKKGSTFEPDWVFLGTATASTLPFRNFKVSINITTPTPHLLSVAPGLAWKPPIA